MDNYLPAVNTHFALSTLFVFAYSDDEFHHKPDCVITFVEKTLLKKIGVAYVKGLTVSLSALGERALQLVKSHYDQPRTTFPFCQTAQNIAFSGDWLTAFIQRTLHIAYSTQNKLAHPVQKKLNVPRNPGKIAAKYLDDMKAQLLQMDDACIVANMDEVAIDLAIPEGAPCFFITHMTRHKRKHFKTLPIVVTITILNNGECLQTVMGFPYRTSPINSHNIVVHPLSHSGRLMRLDYVKNFVIPKVSRILYCLV